jgi:hypothetical protein
VAVIKKVVAPVVKVIRQHAPMIGTVVGGVIGGIAGIPAGPAGMLAGAQAGATVGSQIGIAAQFAVASCIPEKSLTIKCT